jgi:signal transduction histidine kinase
MRGPSAIGITAGPEHRWVFVNEARAKMAGRAGIEHFIGKPVRETYPELKGLPFFDLLDRVYQSGVPYVGRELRAIFNRGPNGEPEEAYVNTLYQPIRNLDGAVEGLLIHTVEVTEQVVARRALEAANQREKELRGAAEFERNQLRELFVQAPVGIGILSGPEHRWSFVNAAFAQLMGRPWPDLANRTVRETLPELATQGLFELLDQVYLTGQTFIGNDRKVTLHRGPGGAPEETYFDFIYQPTRNLAGAVEGIMVLAVEVTNQVAQRALLESSVQERTIELQRARETLRVLSARLMQAQDDERRRVARELHDSAGQYLAAIQMNLSSVQAQSSDLPQAIQARLADSVEMVSRCTAEIRTLSYLLHPPLLDEMGLASAIAWFAEGFSQRSGIPVALDIPCDLPRFSPDVETAIFRVVQQSLANIHRHSLGSAARIHLAVDAGQLTVEISDDGQGVPPDILARFRESRQLPGVGISGMRERISNMGGSFNLHSSSSGTTITATVPGGSDAGTI